MQLQVSAFDLEETITGRVVHPWVVVRAAYASLQVDGFAGNFLGGQFAGVGHPAGWLAFDHTFLPPWFEVLGLGDSKWSLHPLNDLCHCDEVDIFVIGQDLIDPVEEGIQEFGIVLQPSRMEVQTQWCTILIVMTIEIVIEEVVELITGQNVRA